MKALVTSGAPAVCIFGKSWDFQVKKALRISLDENVFMMAESVKYLKKKGLEVLFDAEHFFDGYKENPRYALETVSAAADAGADWVVLCDTNGGTLPHEVATIVRDVHLKIAAPVGIHAHNDCDCARRELAGGGAGRRTDGAGHHQRIRRALREREPLLGDTGPRAEDER